MEELNKGYEFTKAQIAELESLRAWKAEIEKQEPVAHMNAKRDMTFIHGPYNPDDIPLFAAPVVSPDVEKLKALSVTNIMIDVVPGEDGSGHEVYAKSVEDVVMLLTRLSEKAEEYDMTTAPLLAENQSLKTELEATWRIVRLYERLDSPIGNILTSDQRKFLFDNEYELKYLPIYADQPDPTCIVKWVFEVRDKHGAAVAGAHEWLYQAIGNAKVAAIEQAKGGVK